LRTSRWRLLRAEQLAASPHCLFCRRGGQLTVATKVDHAVPHRGNEQRFFDDANLISLCRRHYDAAQRRRQEGHHVIAVE
jgi:5-methylcytosine-specific restriction protein A